MTNSLASIADRWKQILGPLGWGTLLVFLVARSFDVISILTRWYTGSHLSAIDYGAVDPVISVITFFCLPINVLLQISVKSISRLNSLGLEPKAKTLVLDMLRLALIGSGLAVIIVFLLKGVILERLHLDGAMYAGIIAGLFVLMWWHSLLIAVYQGRTNYTLIFSSSILPAALILGFTVILISWAGMDLKGALVARLIGYSLSVLFFMPGVVKSISGLRESYDNEFVIMKQMLIPMSIYLLSAALLSNFDKLIVRNFLLADSGGYGAILTIGSIPMSIMGAIVFVVFPLASAEHASGQDLKRFFMQSLILGGIVTLICVVVFGVLAAPVMRMWNVEFAPYARFVWIYALVAGLHGLIQIIASVEMARHRYSFLWLMLAPALLMCGTLLHCAWHSSLTISRVFGILVATHVFIFAGMSAYSFYGGKNSCRLK